MDEAIESSDSKADFAPPQPKQRTARMVPAAELHAAPLAGHDRSGNGTVQTAEPSEELLRGLAAEDDFFLPSDAEGPAPTQVFHCPLMYFTRMPKRECLSGEA